MTTTSMIRLSEAASLGLHTMRLLAQSGPRRLTTHEIASWMGASEAHLSKVLQRLGRRGLVTSVRGPAGGFSLASDPGAITLMDIYDAIEGPFSDETCFLGRSECPAGECMFGGLVETVNALARKRLEETTLADLVGRDGGRKNNGAT